MLEAIVAKLGWEGIIFLSVFAVTEILPFTPLKSNGIVQMIVQFLEGLKPLRQEDEKVALLKEKVLALYEELRNLDK